MLELTLCFSSEIYVNTPFEIDKEHFYRVIPINGKMNTLQIGSFVAALLSFSDINFDRLIEELSIHAKTKEQLGLSGGLVFKKDGFEIPFSCCCDFAQWLEVSKSIQNKEQIWMGHDPTPICKYENDTITLIASEEDENSERIHFTQDEFTQAIVTVKKDILAFLTLFSDWAKQNFKHDADRLLALMSIYLSIDRF